MAKKPPKEEPKWRMVERVVGLLERTLDRAATVEHDVHLPDLTSKEGHTRQCDVVVTTGPERRRTRTIVEVQRRGKKVEIAHFTNWVGKMRDVGAQHLICVSTVGYPASVKEKAAQLGLDVGDFADSFEMNMGYVDAFRLWGLAAFDDREHLQRYLDATAMPARWAEWIAEQFFVD